MAVYILAPYETRQYSDDNGAPLAGGRLSAYLSGTSTPAPTYADAIGTPNPSPLVFDSAGRCTVYLDTSLTYKFLITDAAGVTIETVDPINPLPTVTPGNVFTVGPGSAAFPGFTFTGDENTGLYGPGADILAVTTGGTERARWGPTGGLNIGGTTDPGDDNLRVEGTLTVQGATTLTGALSVGGAATFSGGIVGTLSAAGLTVTTLGVSGLATMATLNVTGNEAVGGTLDVSGGTTLHEPLLLALMTDLHGLTIRAETSGRPLVSLENVASGLLGQIIGTAGKGIALTTNGGANYALSAFASGGVYVGGPTPVDPGAHSLHVAGALGVTGATTLTGGIAGSLAVSGNVGVGGTLAVTGDVTAQAALGVVGRASVGVLGVGGAAVTDKGGTPTLQSGFPGATIQGRDYAFVILTSSGQTGVIAFSTPFASPPVAVACSNQLANGTVCATTTASTVTVTTQASVAAGTAIWVLVRGV